MVFVVFETSCLLVLVALLSKCYNFIDVGLMDALLLEELLELAVDHLHKIYCVLCLSIVVDVLRSLLENFEQVFLLLLGDDGFRLIIFLIGTQFQCF